MARRRALGLSREQFAAAAGVSYDTLRRLERGRRVNRSTAAIVIITLDHLEAEAAKRGSP